MVEWNDKKITTPIMPYEALYRPDYLLIFACNSNSMETSSCYHSVSGQKSTTNRRCRFMYKILLRSPYQNRCKSEKIFARIHLYLWGADKCMTTFHKYIEPFSICLSVNMRFHGLLCPAANPGFNNKTITGKIMMIMVIAITLAIRTIILITISLYP